MVLYINLFREPVMSSPTNSSTSVLEMPWFVMEPAIKDMVWYEMLCYAMLWYDMICYDMIWYDMIWYDTIWYDMAYHKANDITRADIW